MLKSDNDKLKEANMNLNKQVEEKELKISL